MAVLEGADEPVLLWKQMISRGQADLAPAHRAFCRAALKAHSQRLAAPACAENTAHRALRATESRSKRHVVTPPPQKDPGPPRSSGQHISELRALELFVNCTCEGWSVALGKGPGPIVYRFTEEVAVRLL
jgi:hypothetical protein